MFARNTALGLNNAQAHFVTPLDNACIGNGAGIVIVDDFSLARA